MNLAPRGFSNLVPLALVAVASCSTPSRQANAVSTGAAPDFNGTWGHQQVFALDLVSGEKLPDGSIRPREIEEPVDPPAPDFPKYKP